MVLVYYFHNYPHILSLNLPKYGVKTITCSIIPTDENIAELPHVRRDQLILAKFLGSGAFGEVFEGVAQNIISDEPDTVVAVKVSFFNNTYMFGNYLYIFVSYKY